MLEDISLRQVGDLLVQVFEDLRIPQVDDVLDKPALLDWESNCRTQLIWALCPPDWHRVLAEGICRSIFEVLKFVNFPKRNRNVSWFNPPYSSSVKSNIGAQFLKIISETFPKTSFLYKIANRSKIKVSYRCMPNMRAIISRQNHKNLNQQTAAPPPTCNCQKKAECPLPGRCTIERVCYQADVKRLDTGAVETYTGATMGSFKKRHYGHKTSFENRKWHRIYIFSILCGGTTYIWKY